MLYTDNIGLKKPAYSELADIADINENSDIIDREFGNRYLKSETYSVEQANNAIAQAIEALPNGLVYRGAVNYYKDLPTENNELGDTYSVKYQGETGTTADGNEYAWGEYGETLQWIKLGVNAYNKDEIDAMHDEMQTEIDANKSDILSLEENKMTYKYGRVYADGSNKGDKWYKLATFKSDGTTSQFNSVFYITDRRMHQYGILQICIEKTSTLSSSIITGEWISTENASEAYQKQKNFVITATLEGDYILADLWCKVPNSWHGYSALQLLNIRFNHLQTPDDMGWKLLVSNEPYDIPYDTYPELTSPTVRVVYTKDKLAEALKKIDNFETRITALETAQTTTASE